LKRAGTLILFEAEEAPQEEGEPEEEEDGKRTYVLRIAPGHDGAATLILVAAKDSKDKTQVLQVAHKMCGGYEPKGKRHDSN